MNIMSKPLIAITGASSGIGEAIARRFSEVGYPLLLIARRVEKLDAFNLPNTMCKKVDVTDSNSFKQAIQDAESQYGPVECLINNAGLMLLGQIDKQDASEWERMYSLNVLALLNCMQTVLTSMKDRKSGTIINISSVAGRKTFANHAAYCGTKFAVSAISENVREEVAGYGVRVSAICPGAVETELLGHTTSDDIKTGYEDWKQGMGGALVADDIAQSALFIFEQPQSVCIRELVVAATGQEP